MRLYPITLVIVALLSAVTTFTLTRNRPAVDQLIGDQKFVASLQEVLKISLAEYRFQHLYQYQKDKLRISDIPIPFTEQQSVIQVSGVAHFGIDAESADINVDHSQRLAMIRVNRPALLSLDLDYKFLQEDDTFLNRINPNDRTSMLRSIRSRVSTALDDNQTRDKAMQRAQELLNQFGGLMNYQIELNEKAVNKQLD